MKVDGHGIDSIAKFFLDFGYQQREELRFPAKKLRALWFAPPEDDCSGSGGLPLPRIFISELLVDEMSSQNQVFVNKCNHLMLVFHCFVNFLLHFFFLNAGNN